MKFVLPVPRVMVRGADDTLRETRTKHFAGRETLGACWSSQGHRARAQRFRSGVPGARRTRRRRGAGGTVLWARLLVTCRDLSWLDLAWIGLAWLGLDWLVLAWLGLACLALPWLGLSWLGLSWLGLPWLGLAWLGLPRLASPWLGLAWLRCKGGSRSQWAFARGFADVISVVRCASCSDPCL